MMKDISIENELSKIIVESAFEVHRTLGGPGLLEQVYEEALAWELINRGVIVDRQMSIPINYKSMQLAAPLRLDLLVAKKVIVEVKATSDYHAIYEVQALTYLRLMNLQLALVINFGGKYLKSGIHRVVNGL